MENITHPHIQDADYQTMQRYAKNLDVKFTNQTKEKLRNELHVALEKASKDYPTFHSKYYLRFGNMIADLMADSSTSHSDKIRSLYDLGVIEVNELVMITGRHYSFVHGVVKRYMKKH